mmetsp:Transcript_55145/g.165193  ORF Transcript_55145/g.165193 Transcript_55145/m.165193 type:complete len:400 (-) Transcript_55145:963-2162(-)
MAYTHMSPRKKNTSALKPRAPSRAHVGFLAGGYLINTATVVAQPPPLAPEWIHSLPFAVRLEGEIVQTLSSSWSGLQETRTDQIGEIGVTNTTRGVLAGSAWVHVANEMGMDPDTQNNFGAKNDYEVTHFDGLGGAVRMMARQCPPPVSDGTQENQDYFDETGDGYQPCQCFFEATPSEGVEGCKLPTKFSCLPEWETCVTSEDYGCPLSEAIQRRSWGYAPPECDVGPFDNTTLPSNVAVPFNDTDQFVVCRSVYAFGGQIEAVSVGEDDDGVPAYDVESTCNPSHQSSSCKTSYVTAIERLTPDSSVTFLDADPAGFVACLGDAAAEDASEAFCNGRGRWTWDASGADAGDEPSPFRCICNNPAAWTGDRCDKAVFGSCSSCRHGTSTLTVKDALSV